MKSFAVPGTGLLRLVVLGGLALMPGCVSQATYEEARSAVAVERAAHHRAEARLRQLHDELAAVRADAQSRESAILEQERQIAEADLHLKVANQERDEHGQLVDQLRGELARVGDHLRVFSKEKEQLAEELRDVEQRSRSFGSQERRIERLMEVVRDLTLLEGQAIKTGSVVLATNAEDAILRVSRRTLAPRDSLGADGKRLVLSLAKLCKLHGELGLVLSERSADGAPPDPLLLRRVAEALHVHGVPQERVVLDVAEVEPSKLEASAAPETQPGEVVFVLRVAPGTGTEPRAIEGQPD